MWELEKYLDIGFDLGCEISIIEMMTKFKSIHNVPVEKIEQMKNRWEEIPNEIAKRVTIIKRTT